MKTAIGLALAIGLLALALAQACYHGNPPWPGPDPTYPPNPIINQQHRDGGGIQ